MMTAVTLGPAWERSEIYLCSVWNKTESFSVHTEKYKKLKLSDTCHRKSSIKEVVNILFPQMLWCISQFILSKQEVHVLTAPHNVSLAKDRNLLNNLSFSVNRKYWWTCQRPSQSKVHMSLFMNNTVKMLSDVINVMNLPHVTCVCSRRAESCNDCCDNSLCLWTTGSLLWGFLAEVSGCEREWSLLMVT